MKREMIQREIDRLQSMMFDIKRMQEIFDRDMLTIPAYRSQVLYRQILEMDDEVRTIGAMINALEGLL